MSNLTMELSYQMQGGVCVFNTAFSRPLTTDEATRINDFKVNLSRANNKMYGIGNLGQHRNESPAHWSDTSTIHSPAAFKSFIDRVFTDVGKQWEAFKVAMNTVPAYTDKVVVGSYNGGSVKFV